MIQYFKFRAIHFLFAAALPVLATAETREPNNGIDSVNIASPRKVKDRFPAFLDVATNPWKEPGADDQRSPCSFLNTLANHGLINRNGTFIDLFDIAMVMEKVFFFSPEFTYQTKILPAIDCNQTYEDELGTIRVDLQALFAPRCKNFRSILVRSPGNETMIDVMLLDQLLTIGNNATLDMIERSASENHESHLSLESIAAFQYYRIFDIFNATEGNHTFEIPESDFMANEILSLYLVGKDWTSSTRSVLVNRLFTFLMWERIPDPFFRSEIQRNFMDANDPLNDFFLELSFSLEDAIKVTFSSNEGDFDYGGLGLDETISDDSFDFDRSDGNHDNFPEGYDFGIYDGFDDGMFALDEFISDSEEVEFFDDELFDDEFFDDGFFDDTIPFGDDAFFFDDKLLDDVFLYSDDMKYVDDDMKYVEDDFAGPIDDSLDIDRDDHSKKPMPSLFPSPAATGNPTFLISPEAISVGPSTAFVPTKKQTEGFSIQPSSEISPSTRKRVLQSHKHTYRQHWMDSYRRTIICFIPAKYCFI
ncbi:unnamed protein product [Pseudo-nitzschia multistriata]|uniref:Heme haloperoxidase family profile domain-containing protein n=1 Tax=Pseudo-nitzschia multistriata TaxID=183589 RepID=A0A448Z474_9STRA|nr:unnamed protein product [Pseudo-nitzschia multistriata]